MTDAQEQALIAATTAGLEADLRAAYEKMLDQIRAGTAPRDAVDAAMASFTGDMAQTMASALSALIESSVGTAAVMAMGVGAVTLSRKLWVEGTAVGDVVDGIVKRHVSGFIDARRLALELFEGYGFREPGAEPLQFNPANDRLPQYLRDALLTDDAVQSDLAKAFARIQVDGLSSPALRAAYSELLDAIDGIEAKGGDKLLAKRLETAFFERMRYFSTRIAQTELHRAYMQREAAILMLDEDVEFVQIRRTPPAETCICSLYAGRDIYGLGAGVYPKRLTPVPPYHPFCLTGDAVVTHSGRIAAASRRWFDGDVFVVTTASGKRLTATANHPILTRRGWVGAGLLDLGDDVVARLDRVAVGGDAIDDDDHQDMPASIAEIADAFLSSSEVATREVPLTAEHFHGDGVGSDVAVVGAYRQLRDGIDAAASEVAQDHFLDLADSASAGLLGERVLDLGDETARDATNCVVCGGSKRAALVGGEFGHADEIGRGPAADIDPSTLKAQGDDAAADAEMASQIKDGATGPVFFDQVVNVDRIRFAGHVFNLETEQGHYTANGIVTHNCRCRMVPRPALTGKTATDPDEGADRYFLSRLNAPMAARVMGSRAKADAVLAGQSADAVYNARIVPQYKVKTVEDVTSPAART